MVYNAIKIMDLLYKNLCYMANYNEDNMEEKNINHMANYNEDNMEEKNINHMVIKTMEDNPATLMKLSARHLYMNVRGSRPYNFNLKVFMQNINTALYGGLLFCDAYYELCCQTYLRGGIHALCQFMFIKDDNDITLPVIYSSTMTAELEKLKNQNI